MTIKSLIQSIRAILLNDWDPLIVGDNPHLSDEYDDYIPAIVKLLEIIVPLNNGEASDMDREA